MCLKSLWSDSCTWRHTWKNDWTCNALASSQCMSPHWNMLHITLLYVFVASYFTSHPYRLRIDVFHCVARFCHCLKRINKPTLQTHCRWMLPLTLDLGSHRGWPSATFPGADSVALSMLHVGCWWLLLQFFLIWWLYSEWTCDNFCLFNTSNLQTLDDQLQLACRNLTSPSAGSIGVR